jgi:hypothetical protein
MNPYIQIGGKDIFVVEKHNQVIHAWAEIRAQIGSAPDLSALDIVKLAWFLRLDGSPD